MSDDEIQEMLNDGTPYVAEGWRTIDSAPFGRTVLTQHWADLYPVPAYRLEPGLEWLRETEGPEDSFYGGGRHEPLFRHPTHWMPLPDPPQEQE